VVDVEQGTDEPGTGTAGRVLVAALAVAGLLVIGYFALGMPGMDHGTSPTGSAEPEAMDHESMSTMHLGPRTFAERVADPAVFVVNVHTPYAGEIDGTDAFIPFDEIAGDRRLPADRTAPIALYCESGRMSGIAAEVLLAAGYTDVADLDGGMQAWEAAGLPITQRPGADG